MQAARAVTRSISGVASSMADSAAAQDDADEERRRNARASWKRATTKVASALRLAREDQQEGEVAGALHGMEEELELARREEEELIREAEEDNKLVFIERVKAAAFAVSDLMMRDLMAFIVSYPVKCLELMRDMESALPDESMDPPAFGGIMDMLRGQGPLFCVRRMYSGFGCALVAQMGGTLLEEAPFFVCRALGLFERDSALANSAFAVVYTGVVVAVPFKLVGEAAVVRRVFAACSSSPSPPSPVVVQFAQAFRALFVRREVPWWVLAPRALSTFAHSYMVKCSMLHKDDTEPDIWLSNFVSAMGLSPPLPGAEGGGGEERGAAGRRCLPLGTYLFRMCFIKGGVKEGRLSDEVVLNLQWALGLFVSLALNPPITVENLEKRMIIIRSFPWLFQPIIGTLHATRRYYNSLDGWMCSKALGLTCFFAGHRAWLNRYPDSRSGMIRRLSWRHQGSEMLESILVSVPCCLMRTAVSSAWLKLRQRISSLVFEDASQRLVRKLRHARDNATRARGHIDLGSKPAPGPRMQRETTMGLKTAAAASVGEKHSALLDRLVVHYKKLADGMDRRCSADNWHRLYLQTGVLPLMVSRSDLDETVGEIGLILPVPLVLGLRVKFTGEKGQDAGGLFRELMSLLSHHFEHELTEGGKKGGEEKSGEGVRAETGAGADKGAGAGVEKERGMPQDQQQKGTCEGADLSPPSMHPLAPVPVGHTRFSWVPQGAVVPVGHTTFSWNSNPSPPPRPGVLTCSVLPRTIEDWEVFSTIDTERSGPGSPSTHIEWGWARVEYGYGVYSMDYEGIIVRVHGQAVPTGFGRMRWSTRGIAYHGFWNLSRLEGYGTFFFPNGDMLEGCFEANKLIGAGILTVLKTGERFKVEYDPAKELCEEAVPVDKALVKDPLYLQEFSNLYADAMVLPRKRHARVPLAAVSRGSRGHEFVGDYSHCTDVDGVLAYAVPLRAHRPLENSGQLVGKIAVVQYGSCSLGKKLRYVQAAGAIAMLVIGTDDADKLVKSKQAIQLHSGNPLEDDPWPEGGVPAPVVTAIPVCYVKGRDEKAFPHGAHVQLSFSPGALGTPKGWLLGMAYVKKVYESPQKRPSESPFEANYGGRGVYYRAILADRYPKYATIRARVVNCLLKFVHKYLSKRLKNIDHWLPRPQAAEYVYCVDYGDHFEIDVPVHRIRRFRKPDSLFVRGPDGGLMPQRLPPVSLRGESLDAAAVERLSERRRYFFVVGRLMALAIVRKTPLDITWSRCIYKVLVGEAITLADVKRLDPDLVRHRILPLLEDGGVARMQEILCDELFFVAVHARQYGEEAEEDVVELVPGGKGIRVTEQNKKRYVELLVEHYVLPCCQAASLASLIEGFYDIIPRAILLETSTGEEGEEASSGLSALDLELMVCGVPNIDVGEWQEFARDNSEGAFPALFGLLWEVVEEMDTANRAKLLAFTCGSGRLPAQGFAGLVPPFNIEVNRAESTENLPSAHTCFNQLCLPNYQEKEQLRSKLLLAINSDAGFGFL